jgi:hypothetical protein
MGAGEGAVSGLYVLEDGSLVDTLGWTKHTPDEVIPHLARFLAERDA